MRHSILSVAAQSRLWVGVLLLFGSAVTASQLPPGDAAADWQFIQKLRADGMRQAAARELLRFAQDHASDTRAPGALFAAGQEFESLEQSALALSAYDRLLREHPQASEVPSALLRKGQLLADAARFTESTEAYRSLLIGAANATQREEAQLGLAEALLAQGLDTDARRNLLQLVRGASARVSARARYDLGLLHLRAAEDSLAIVQFDLAAERQPKELIAAFALLRAAERLADVDDRAGAKRRYTRVLEQFSEEPLRARAQLGLAALARADGDEKTALAHYRAVAEGEGAKDQIALGWIGVAQSALELSDLELVEAAAAQYLEGAAPIDDRSRARLLRAQAMRRRGVVAAVDSLRALTQLTQREIVHAAHVELALAAQSQAQDEVALDAWREAARTAPDRDAAAEAILAEAKLVADQTHRAGLASQLAEEAARRAESAAIAARALWIAAQRAREAQQPARAHSLALRLAREFPLSEQAQLAELMMRQLSEAMHYDVVAAASELAEVAAREDLTPHARAVAIGLIERDRWGELERAGATFERSLELASTSAEQARSGCELARTQERLALAAALDGSEDAARSALLAAMRHFATASAIEAGGEAAKEARLGSLRLELALAAAPAAPWFFDASISPLRGGVGAVEAAEPGAARFDAIRAGIDASRQEAHWAADELAWLLWRQAELSSASIEDRLSMLDAALAKAVDPRLRDSISFSRAQLRLTRGLDEAAVGELRRLTQAAEGETALAARYLLAEQDRAAKRFAGAEQLYLQFAGALPWTQLGERALLLAGDCAFFLAQPQRAESRYRELLARNENSNYADDALYRLATAQMRLGRGESAREALQRLAQWEGGSDYAGRALLRLAELARGRGEFATAIAHLTQLLERDVDLARREDAWLQLAALSLQAERPNDALTWLKRREEQQSSDASGLALRVRAEAARGDWSAATASLKRLEREYAQARDVRASAKLDLADALATAEQFAAAREQLEAAAQLAESKRLRARAAYGLALLLVHSGDLEAARAQLAHVLEIDGDGEFGAPALYQRARLQERAQDDAKAQASYAQLVAHHPQHELAPDALRSEARVWKDMGRYDEALTRYQRLLEDYPSAEDGAELLAQIAYCQHELGQFEASIASYRRVMPELAEEERGYAQFWVADAYAQLGRHDQAAAEFLRIPFLYPTLGELPVTAQLKAGEAFERAGDPQSAQGLYERVLKAHGPQSTWGAEARKRLERSKSVTSKGESAGDGS